MDLSRYYEEICREPILPKEVEDDLFLELEDRGLSEARRNQIRDKIIRSHLRFVFKQAKYFSKNDPELFKELICAGNEGLIVGMNKYDLSRGMRFLTYAGYWVNQRILKHMAGLRIVSLPIWKQQLAAKIQKFCDNNESVTLEVLKREFPEVKEKDLEELFQTRYLTYYIEDIGEDPAFEITPIESEVESKLDRQRLHDVINSLPELHKSIIMLSFGLADGTERNNNEIMAELSISREKLKETKKEALSLLKERMGPESPFDH